MRPLSLLRRGAAVVPVLFADPRPEVRTEAAAWAAEWPLRAVIERLRDMLGDPRNLCRFTVKDSLLRLGLAAVEPLARRLGRLDGLALREAMAVAAGLADARLLAPVLPLCGHPDADVRALAASIVGAIGREGATRRLEALLDDPEPAPRAASARALGHLGHWPAATRMALLLRDPAWDVRSAAAVALRGLGAAGTLLLRRTLDDGDPFARDMARRTLDLPTAVGPGAPA